MSSRPRDTPLASPLPPAIARYLAVRGIGPSVLSARFGLPSDVAEREDAPIDLFALDELLGFAADACGEPSLALRLPAELPFRRYGLHELIAQASADVRAAMLRTARYAPIIHPKLSLSLEESEGEARWRHRTLGHPRGIGRASNEYALGAAFMHLERAVGVDARLRRVWFIHARPRALGPLHRFFGTRELEFGREDNGFSFDAELLARPLVGGDPRLLATLEPMADEALRIRPAARDFAAQVAERVRAMLPGAVDVEAIAAALHMSARTLQRRLGDLGTQFSEVLDEVRADEARRALAGAASLLEIAYRLGYADLAAFSRAFKRWTGLSPGRFRRGG